MNTDYSFLKAVVALHIIISSSNSNGTHSVCIYLLI